jgi:hypothetical protein
LAVFLDLRCFRNDFSTLFSRFHKPSLYERYITNRYI